MTTKTIKKRIKTLMLHEFRCIREDTGEVVGKTIRALPKPWDEDAFFAATIEQLYGFGGPRAVASYLSKSLHDPSTSRIAINVITRLLDPQDNSSLRLAVQRRRSGKSWIKHVNDAPVARMIKKYQQTLGRKRLGKKTVGDIADQFKISPAKVRKVISQSRK